MKVLENGIWKYQCRFCKAEFKSGSQLGGHALSCSLNPKHSQNSERIRQNLVTNRMKKLELENPIIERTVECSKCGKIFSLEKRKNYLLKKTSFFCSVFCR